MNAKQEFLKTIEKHKLICCTISISHDWYNSTVFNLKPGYTPEEYDEFVNNLNFEYDNGYGTQELYGTIWCEDGVWFDRHEYDGSECWDGHKYPSIPDIDEWGTDVVQISEADYWDGDESDKSLQ